jgi:multiple sugar transport system permease protein
MTYNYTEAFTAVPLARYFMNTVVCTGITTALMLVVIVLFAIRLVFDLVM